MQTAAIEKRHLDLLLAEFPQARRSVRRATVRLAFVRAMVRLAQVFAREQQCSGRLVDVYVALALLQEELAAKAMPRLLEPNKKAVVSAIAHLHERIEALDASQSAMAANVASGLAGVHALRNEMTTLVARLDAVLPTDTIGGVLPTTMEACEATNHMVGAEMGRRVAAAAHPLTRAGRSGQIERPPPARRKQQRQPQPPQQQPQQSSPPPLAPPLLQPSQAPQPQLQSHHAESSHGVARAEAEHDELVQSLQA